MVQLLNTKKEKVDTPTRLRLCLAECSRSSTLQAIFFFAVLIALAAIHRLSVTQGNGPAKLAKGSTPKQILKQLKAAGLTPIYDPAKTTDPWKAELFQRLDRIRVACGKLCQLNSLEALKVHATVVPVPDAAFSMLQVEPVDCPALLQLEEIDAADHTAPSIPDELRPYFTLNNAYEIDTREKLRRDIYLGKSTIFWKENNVNSMIRQAAEGTLRGTYGAESTKKVRDEVGKLPLRDASVLVIGSEQPWLEAVLLHHGAAKVTTLEYGTIVSQHPKIETMTPSHFRERYLNGTMPMFDGVLSHSSLEHSGLGRYGDALNPWGDILTVARAWCVTKENGFLYLGLPTGKDAIFSNWHRIYGAIRWPLVTANWKPLPGTVTAKDLEKHVMGGVIDGGSGVMFTKHSVRSSG